MYAIAVLVEGNSQRASTTRYTGHASLPSHSTEPAPRPPLVAYARS